MNDCGPSTHDELVLFVPITSWYVTPESPAVLMWCDLVLYSRRRCRSRHVFVVPTCCSHLCLFGSIYKCVDVSHGSRPAHGFEYRYSGLPSLCNPHSIVWVVVRGLQPFPCSPEGAEGPLEDPANLARGMILVVGLQRLGLSLDRGAAFCC